MRKEKKMSEEKKLKEKADEAVKEGNPFWYAPPAIKAEKTEDEKSSEEEKK